MASERTLYAKEDRRMLRRAGETVDIPFLILILLLLAVGLTMLYSASSAQSAYDTRYQITTRYLQKQAVCAGLGLICMWFFSRIPAQVWFRLAWPLYGISIILLLLVLARRSPLVISTQILISPVICSLRRALPSWLNLSGIRVCCSPSLSPL